MVLWITSVILTLLYCGLGGTIFYKYWSLMDVFQRAAIIGFTIEMLAKSIFWIVAWDYYELYKETFPVRTTLGAFITAISFITYQIIIMRVIVEYD